MRKLARKTVEDEDVRMNLQTFEMHARRDHGHDAFSLAQNQKSYARLKRAIRQSTAADPPMSQTPGISNLLDRLRAGREGSKNRGRGGSSASQSTLRSVNNYEPTQEQKDAIIQQTDGDASVSRMSAVALGYIDDDFARPFVTPPIARRQPIINRGI